MKKLKIAFFWFGMDGRYGAWKDGLYAALKLIETEHEVRYYDVNEKTLKDVKDFNPDVVLFWEAPVCNRGKDADMWFSICALPYKKALLFAGGPLKAIDVRDFDLVFVESQINEEDCEREGISYKRAFGVNTQIFDGKRYAAINVMMQATFAEWKRHTLFAQALQGIKDIYPLAIGRVQEHDRNGYDECIKRGIHVVDEQPAERIALEIGMSLCVLNTSEYWGGGQRCTLESLAMGIPAIVMSDSPKNREFVEESGGGYVVEPNADKIKETIAFIKSDIVKNRLQVGNKGRAYVMSKWTERHYADALLEGIQSII